MFRPQSLRRHIRTFGPVAHRKNKLVFRQGILFSYAFRNIISGARKMGRVEHLPAWLTGLTDAFGRTLIFHYQERGTSTALSEGFLEI